MPDWGAAAHGALSLGLLALLICLAQARPRWAPRLAVGLVYAVCLWGYHWIFTSLHTHGQMAWPIAAAATMVLALYVALYGFAAIFVVRRWALGPWQVAAVVALLEWARGFLFSGFPWMNWGLQQVDTPLSGYAPWLGGYGVVFATALCAAFLARAMARGAAQAPQRFRALALAGLIIALGAIAGLPTFTEPTGQPLRTALIQGAIGQSQKFDPVEVSLNEQVHLAMVARASEAKYRTQLVVLPETAFIYPWQDLDVSTRQALQGLARENQVTILTGIPSQEGGRWWNSVVGILPDQAEIGYRYDKHHLVPFGEFIPWGFEWFLALMRMPLGSFEEGAARQLPLGVADQRVGINICFEDLFGEEIIRSMAPSVPEAERPTILLNVSNLAWFGLSNALPQHLAASRMRTLETGRPMIRATNTGVTAHINARGRVTAELASGRRAVLLEDVQGHTGTTPYIALGNTPIVLLALAALLLPGRPPQLARWAAGRLGRWRRQSA